MTAGFLRQRRSMAALAVVAITATACGGSGNGSSAAATSAAGTSAASTASSAAPATSSAAAGTTAPPAAGTTKVKATGGGTFCKTLAAAINNPSAFTGSSTPAKVKSTIAEAIKQSQAALAKAPSTIKPDVSVLLAASEKLYQALAKNDYDITKLRPADVTALSSPALAAAEAHVAAYVKDTCGISLADAVPSLSG